MVQLLFIAKVNSIAITDFLCDLQKYNFLFRSWSGSNWQFNWRLYDETLSIHCIGGNCLVEIVSSWFGYWTSAAMDGRVSGTVILVDQMYDNRLNVLIYSHGTENKINYGWKVLNFTRAHHRIKHRHLNLAFTVLNSVNWPKHRKRVYWHRRRRQPRR